jgi:protein gp37
MSEISKIEWTDATWNPVRGCTKISPGCKHCYAERFSERFRGVKEHPFENGFDLKLVPHKLDEPLRWREARKIFVNSMSDMFHEEIPLAYISRVATIMQLADWHTYQVLTKRSPRLRQLLCGPLQHVAKKDYIWWGVSVEDREYGLPRISDLQACPVAVRFLSIEPLLEDLGELPLYGISWVIVGGESGPGARPMKQEWVLSIREQCKAADIPFFFKQWGGTRKKQTGRTLLGRTHDDFPKRSSPPAVDQVASFSKMT